jgi:hypothetical protein
VPYTAPFDPVPIIATGTKFAGQTNMKSSRVIPPKNWNEFWSRETAYLAEGLRWPLVGGAPVSVLTYQPGPEERLVYLHEGQTENFLHVDNLSRDFICNASPQTPWHSKVCRVQDAQIKEFMVTEHDVRKRVFDAETRKYPHYPYSSRDGFLKRDTEYRLQLLFAAPVYCTLKDWWKRLPRLGYCYTVEDQLGKPHTPAETLPKAPTDQMLMIMAVSVAIRLLDKRLRLVFNNSYRWSKDGSSKEDYVEVKTPQIICNLSKRKVDDRSIFFVAKLILAHHLFFPHSPEALRIFQLLSNNKCDDILALHGWPKTSRPISPTTDLRDSVNNLATDLHHLTHAIERWSGPVDAIAGKKECGEAFPEHVRLALALLCGEPKWDASSETFMIVPPLSLQDLGPINMPVFSKRQLVKKGTGQPSFYLETLCPIGNDYPQPKWNITAMDGMIFPAGDGPKEDEHKLEWTSKYIYSRYLLAFPGMRTTPRRKPPRKRQKVQNSTS